MSTAIIRWLSYIYPFLCKRRINIFGVVWVITHRQTYTNKSMSFDGMHPWLLRELADVVLLLSTISGKSWIMGEGPDDWRNASVTSIFKKGKNENPGNYHLLSLTSIPAMIMKKVILEVVTKDIKEKMVIRNSQCRFIKGKSSFTNLTAFWDDMAGWIDKERAVDLSTLASQEFCTVSHDILAGELRKCGWMDSEVGQEAEWQTVTLQLV